MMEIDDDDYLDWSDDDIGICTSRYVVSSDEDDIPFTFIPKNKGTKRRMCSVPGRQADSDEDDFGKEMASELSLTMQHLASAIAKNKTQAAASSSGKGSEADKANTGEEDEFYDDVYFDSDDSDLDESEATQASTQASGTKKKKTKHRVMTNDELLYDPTLDDQDQEWVNKQRRKYQVKQKGMKKGGSGRGGKSSSQPALPHSDAVLNCPACLTTLCMDCQRHEIYHNQYRAMFVFNCKVDVTESLKFPSKMQKKKEYFKNKRKKKGYKVTAVIKEEVGEGAVGGRKEEVREEAVGGRKEEEGVSMEEGRDINEEGGGDGKEEGVGIGEGGGGREGGGGGCEKEGGVCKKEEGGGGGMKEGEFTQSAGGSVQNSQPSSSNDPESNSFKGGDDDEMYNPVMCKICNTKVAVYDKDEVYHFFNVVTSY